MECHDEKMDLVDNAFDDAANRVWRLIILGSTKTGKTSIANKFVNGQFIDTYVPTIDNVFNKFYRVNNELFRVEIIDTSGNNPFPAAKRQLLLSGDMFLLVFSVDQPHSFEEIFIVYNEILEARRGLNNITNSGVSEILSNLHIKSSSGNSSSLPLLIAANKMDLPKRQHLVDLTTVGSKLTKLNCPFLECSAKYNVNVSTLFHRLYDAAKLPKQMGAVSGTNAQPINLKALLDAEVTNAVQQLTSSCGHLALAQSTNNRLRSNSNHFAAGVRRRERAHSLQTSVLLATAHKNQRSELNLLSGGRGGEIAQSRKHHSSNSNCTIS